METVEKRRKSKIEKKKKKIESKKKKAVGRRKQFSGELLRGEGGYVSNRYAIKFGSARTFLHWSGEGLKFRAFVNRAWGLLFGLSG